jgi:hypothetical protein
MRQLRAQMSASGCCLIDAFPLAHAGRGHVQYRALTFKSDCHPFVSGRPSIRVRPDNGCSPAFDLSIDGSCALSSCQRSSGASAISGQRNVRKLLSFWSDTCTYILASVSTQLIEYSRQFLDPIVSASGGGIEIEGLGRRLVRDGHTELDSNYRERAHADHISTKL